MVLQYVTLSFNMVPCLLYRVLMYGPWVVQGIQEVCKGSPGRRLRDDVSTLRG